MITTVPERFGVSLGVPATRCTATVQQDSHANFRSSGATFPKGLTHWPRRRNQQQSDLIRGILSDTSSDLGSCWPTLAQREILRITTDGRSAVFKLSSSVLLNHPPARSQHHRSHLAETKIFENSRMASGKLRSRPSRVRKNRYSVVQFWELKRSDRFEVG